MSKQSEAKERQRYVEKPIIHVCGTCANITANFVEDCVGYDGVRRTIEKCFRCSIGGFAVKKTAVCSEWEGK